MLTAGVRSCQADRCPGSPGTGPPSGPCQAAVTRRVRPPSAQLPVAGQVGYSTRVPVRTGVVNAQP